MSEQGRGAPQSGDGDGDVPRAAGSWLVVLSVLIGVAGGVGAFTFRYAEGFSYLSSDPKACVNCHIMRSQYESWQKASHHAAAVCVDCHLPHDFFGKYFAKAENGYHHSEAFTLQNFHEPIVMKPKARRILQENCVTCHADLTHDIAHGALTHDSAHGARGARDELTCVHCHPGVGHGDRAGLGGPLPPISEANPHVP